LNSLEPLVKIASLPLQLLRLHFCAMQLARAHSFIVVKANNVSALQLPNASVDYATQFRSVRSSPCMPAQRHKFYSRGKMLRASIKELLARALRQLAWRQCVAKDGLRASENAKQA
jgi:hypothetical protein